MARLLLAGAAFERQECRLPSLQVSAQGNQHHSTSRPDSGDQENRGMAQRGMRALNCVPQPANPC